MKPVVLASFLAASCTVTLPQDEPDPGPRRAGQGRWGERVCVDVMALPAVWLEPDTDDRLLPGQRAEAASGPGYALRAALGNRDQSVGVLYQGAFLEEDRTGVDVDMHALYLDFDVSVPVSDGPAPLCVHAAAGFGIGTLDFADPRFADDTTGALNMRIDVEFAPSPQVSLLAGLGGFLWGHPGETEAFGSLLEVGGRVSF